MPTLNAAARAGGAACPCASTGAPVVVGDGRARPWSASMPVAAAAGGVSGASRSSPSGPRPPPGARRHPSSPARPPPSRYPHAGSGPSQGAQPPISGHRHPRNRGRAALDQPVGLLGSASNPPSATVGLPPRSAACQRPSALRSGRAPLDRPASTPQGPPARPCPRPAVPAPR